MAHKESFDHNLLHVPVEVQRVLFEGNHRVNTQNFLKFTGQLHRSGNLGEVLNSAQNSIRELNSFDSFKDIKISLEEGSNDIHEKVPVNVRFVVSEKGFGLKSGVEISRNEPCLYFNGQIFNIAGRIGRLSLLSHCGIKNHKPFEIIYDGFMGPFRSSAGIVIHAKESFEFFSKIFSSAYLTLSKPFQSWNFSCCLRIADETLLPSTSQIVSHELRKKLSNALLHSVTFTLSKSSLDSLIIPTTGCKFDTFVKFSTPFNFTPIAKLQAKYQAHYHVKNITLSGYVLGGALLTQGDRWPIDERFYAGGNDSTRGFKFNGLGRYIDGFNSGSDSVLNYAVCLSHNINSSLKNKFSAGVYFCNSLMPYKLGSIRQFSVNSGVGIFVAANMSESARLELSYGMPVKASNSNAVLNGLQLGITMENSFS